MVMHCGNELIMMMIEIAMFLYSSLGSLPTHNAWWQYQWGPGVARWREKTEDVLWVCIVHEVKIKIISLNATCLIDFVFPSCWQCVITVMHALWERWDFFSLLFEWTGTVVLETDDDHLFFSTFLVWQTNGFFKLCHLWSPDRRPKP